MVPDWIVVITLTLSVLALASLYVAYVLDPLVKANKLIIAFIITSTFVLVASTGLVVMARWLASL